MARGQISLSPLAASYLVGRFDAYPHPMLRVGHLPVEATEDDRRRAADLGRKELADRGLLEMDELHPFLEDAWQLLAHPPLAVGLAVHTKKGADFNAVLVEHGRGAVQAYQADGETADSLQDIVLSRHEYGSPAENAINLLGKLTPGSAGSANVPAEQIDNAEKRLREKPNSNLRTALGSCGVRPGDAQVLAKALSGQRELECVITVRAYDRKRSRTFKPPFNLQIFCTEEGCYLTQRKPGGDAREWFTLAPAEPRKLSATIDQMVKPLKAARV